MTIEDIYRDNYHIVYGYLLSLCGSAALAEDLASETFLRAMQHIDRYDGSCKPSTWLCTIGKRLYFNERKRLRRHAALTEDTATEALEDWYERTEGARQICREAQALPPPARQVFTMRLAGLSFREIGQALGRSENWARVTFFRAKHTLVNRLEEYHGS